jgi:hypothetical protein
LKKKLRREDKKEYEADKKEYRKAVKFYFETKRDYLQNNTASLKDIKKQSFRASFFRACLSPGYERLCNAEKSYLGRKSMIKRLEKNSIVTLANQEEARATIEEIKNKCLDIVEGQPILHGLSIEEERLFYSVIEQLKRI